MKRGEFCARIERQKDGSKQVERIAGVEDYLVALGDLLCCVPTLAGCPHLTAARQARH